MILSQNIKASSVFYFIGVFQPLDSYEDISELVSGDILLVLVALCLLLIYCSFFLVAPAGLLRRSLSAESWFGWWQAADNFIAKHRLAEGDRDKLITTILSPLLSDMKLMEDAGQKMSSYPLFWNKLLGLVTQENYPNFLVR